MEMDNFEIHKSFERRTSIKRTISYIQTTNARLKLFEKFKNIKVEVQNAAYAITDKEDEVGKILTEIELLRMSRSFDWQAEKHKRVKELKAMIIVEKEDFEVISSKLKEVTDEIQRKYPDMSSSIENELHGGDNVQQNNSSDIVDTDSIGPDKSVATGITSTSFGEGRPDFVYGWILGKTNNDGDIRTVLFGQFTCDVDVPENDWIYMGTVLKNHYYYDNIAIDDSQTGGITSEQDIREEDSLLLHDFGDEESLTSLDDVLRRDRLRVRVMPGVMVSKAITGDFSNSKASMESVRSFRVSGCSLEAVNGKYLEYGMACDAIRYRNVKGWMLFRHRFREIPDLNILADNCYDLYEGPSTAELQDQRTAQALEDLLRKNSNIESGLRFKRRFAEIARGGMRLVNDDNISAKLHEEALRATARSAANKALLLQLKAMAITKDYEDDELTGVNTGGTHSLHHTGDGFMDDRSEAFGIRSEGVSGVVSVTSSPDKSQRLAVHEEESLEESLHAHDESSTNSFRPHSSQVHFVDQHDGDIRMQIPLDSPGAIAQSPSTTIGSKEEKYVTGANLEFKVKMARNITYQAASLEYHRSDEMLYHAKEAELARLVSTYIEQREAALLIVRAEATRIQVGYITNEGSSTRTADGVKSLGSLMVALSNLRKATIQVAEGIGAWSRLVINQLDKADKIKAHHEHWVGKSDDDSSTGSRGYCVLVASKGKALYQLSEPVVSSSRRYCRGQGDEKRGIDIKYVGVFADRDEAINAFYSACAVIPLELRPKAYKDAPKMLLCMRPCMRHYIIRSEHVPKDLPCQECIAKDSSHPNVVVPSVSERLMPQYLWHGENYLDRMWSDIDFLGDLSLLKHFAPQLDVQYNPLLLSRMSYQQILDSLAMQGKTSTALRALKGKLELVEEAKRAANKARRSITDSNLVGRPYAKAEDRLAQARSLTSISTGVYPVGYKSSRSMEFQPTTKSFFESKFSSYDDKPPPSSSSGKISTDNSFNSDFIRLNQLASPLFYPPTTGDTSFSTIHEDLESKNEHEHDSISSVKFSLEETSLDIEREPKADGLDDSSLSESVGWSLEEFVNSRGLRKSRQAKLTDDFIEQGLMSTDTPRILRAMSILGQSVLLTDKMLPKTIVPHPSQLLSSSEKKRTYTATKDSKRPTFSKSVPTLPKPTSVHRARRAPSASNILSSKTVSTGSLQALDGDQALIPTATFYSHHGAKLVTMQSRQPVAYRTEDTWCRSDVGEWAGLKKRLSMQVFETRQNNLNIARMKAKQWKAVSKDIRSSIKKHFADVNPSKLYNAIAEIVNPNTFLGLDITRAKKYLTHWENASRLLTIAQARIRGILARSLYARLIAERDLLRKIRLSSEDIISSTAKKFYDDVLNVCLRRQVRAQAGPAYKKAINIGGITVVLCVHPAARHGFKSLDLCASCLNRCHTRVYDFDRHCFVRQRAACTCAWKHGREEWLFRGYDPLDCSYSIASFREDLLRRQLAIAHSMSLLTYEEHKKHLVGKSFGMWKILLQSSHIQKNATMGRLREARKQASKELASLSLLPKTFSHNLMRAVWGWASLPADYFKRHGPESTVGPLVVDIDRRADDVPTEKSIVPWHWQPLADIQIAQRRTASLIHDLGVCKNEAEEAAITRHHLAQERKILKPLLECRRMGVEDALSKILRTHETLVAARSAVTKLVHASVCALGVVEEEERNERENRQRAWDPLDDAVSRIALVTRRRNEVQQRANVVEYENGLVALEQDIDAFKLKNAIEREAAAMSRLKKIEFRKISKEVIIAKKKTAACRRMAAEAFHAMSRALCMPVHSDYPIRRKLKLLNFKLSYIRDPLIRARKENRMAWNVHSRRVLFLESVPGPVRWPDGRRYVVTVYADPVTGYKLIQIGQINDVVEEIEMHKDFLHTASFYSLLTSDAERNEVLVTPEDVSELFKHKPGWPRQMQEFSITAKITEKEDDTSLNMNPTNTTMISSSPTFITNTTVGLQGNSKHGLIDQDNASDPRPQALPPLRSRPLDGYKTYKLPDISRSHLPSTYFQRRRKLEQEEKITYDTFLKYLRLHPFTGRPCVGLVHLQRRTTALKRELANAMWYTDLITMKPNSWGNEVFADVRFISERMVTVKLRESWGEFEAEVTLPKGSNTGVVVPFSAIIHSLQDRPLLLSSFLLELIVNQFSTDTIDHIISRFDFVLPGEMNRMWREDMNGESPYFRYLERMNERYRGPICCIHRIISEKYFCVKFFKASNGDLRLALSPPTDSSFWRHEYSGKSFNIDIPVEAIRALVVKVSHDANVVSKNFYGTLNLLLPEYQEQLFNTICDFLVLHPKYYMTDSVKLMGKKNKTPLPSSDRLSMNATSNTGGKIRSCEVLAHESADIDGVRNHRRHTDLPWDQQLIARFHRNLNRFNEWTERHKTRLKPIHKDVVADALQYLDNLNRLPDWQFQLTNDKSSSKQMELYVGIIKAKDPARAGMIWRKTGETDQPKSPKHKARKRSVRGASDTMKVEGSSGEDVHQVDPRFIYVSELERRVDAMGDDDDDDDSIDTHPVGYADKSFWTSRLCIDEGKHAVFVHMMQAQVNDSMVQKAISIEETRLMDSEDTRSRVLNYRYEAKRLEGILKRQIEKTRTALQTNMRRLEVEKRKKNFATEALEKFQQMVTKTVDSYFTARARHTCDALQRRLRIASNDMLDLNVSKPGTPNTENINDEEGDEDDDAFVFDPRLISLYSLPVLRLLRWMHSIQQTISNHQRNAERHHVVTIIEQSMGGSAFAFPSRLVSAAYPRRGLSTATMLGDGDGNLTSATCRDCTSSVCPVHAQARKLRQYKSWSRSWCGKNTHDGQSTGYDMNVDVLKPIIVKHRDRVVLISEPNIGPFDVSVMHIYEPNTFKRWTVLVTASSPSSREPEPLPDCSFWDHPNEYRSPLPRFTPRESIELSDTLVRKDSVSSLESSTYSKSTVSLLELGLSESELLKRRVVEQVAQRLVWRTMAHCVTSTAVKLTTIQLTTVSSDLQRVTLEGVDKLHSCEEYLRAISKSILTYGQLFQVSNKFGEQRLVRSAVCPSLSSALNNTISKQIFAFGLFLPVDERLTPTVIEIPATEWRERCKQLLNSENLVKTTTIPCIAYQDSNVLSNSGHRENIRVGLWISEYIKHVGWRKGFDFIKHQSTLRKQMRCKSYKDPPIFYGNTVVLLRHGKMDFNQLLRWIEERRIAFEKEEESKRIAEEEKKQRIMENFSAFRSAVFVAAERYMWAFERLSGVNRKHPVPEIPFELPRATIRQTRRLLAPGLFQGKHDFLIDKDVLFSAENPELQEIFDTYKIPTVIPLLDENEHSSEIFEDTVDVVVSGQDDSLSEPQQGKGSVNFSNYLLSPTKEVWYALYQLHCSRCVHYNSFCPIHLCGHVRDLARGIEEGMRESRYCHDGSVIPLEDFSVLLGTGKHPLEQALKRMVTENRNGTGNNLVRAASSRAFVATKDVKGYKKQVQSKLMSTDTNNSRSQTKHVMSYRDCITEARHMRFLDRRVIHSSLAAALSPDEVLRAKGGDWMMQEKSISEDMVTNLSKSLPPTIPRDPFAARSSADGMDSDGDDDDENEEGELPQASIKIPVTVLVSLLGQDRSFDYQHGLHAEDIELYPDKQTAKKRRHDDVQPMSNSMFTWLSERLYVYPHMSLLNAQTNGNQAVSHTSSFGVKFDRLHCEAMVVPDDGIELFVQVLHGVLPTETYNQHENIHTSRRSCPMAASRYLMGSELQKLQYGLTIHVHDRHTITGKAVFVKGIELHRMVEYFAQQDASDTAKLSRLFIGAAHVMLKLTRVGNTIASVEIVYDKFLNMAVERNSISTQASSHFQLFGLTAPRTDLKMNAFGRREIVINQSLQRVEVARKLLSRFSSN